MFPSWFYKFMLLSKWGMKIVKRGKYFTPLRKQRRNIFSSTLVPPHQKNPHNPFSNLCLEPGILYRLLDILHHDVRYISWWVTYLQLKWHFRIMITFLNVMDYTFYTTWIICYATLNLYFIVRTLTIKQAMQQKPHYQSTLHDFLQFHNGKCHQ